MIVASGAKASLAAKRATVTTPIVVETGDAVAEGIVTNLARPEGNITGWTFFGPELAAKRLELLNECVPRVTKVAYLTNPADPGSFVSFPALRKAADELKLEAQQFAAEGPDRLDETFAKMIKNGFGAVVVQGDTMFAVNAKAVANLAIKYRLPSAGITEFVKAGGLIGNGVDLIEAHHKLAIFVAKILRGSKPSELPMEQATKFSLAVNTKTAAALGITIPPSLLLRADEVIH